MGDGSVWVALNGGPIVRIDPASLDVQRTYDAGLEGIHSLAFGEGALWASADHAVVRLDPEGGGVVSTPVNNPQVLVIGGGAVWVSAYSSQEVLEIDPRSGAIVGRAAIGDSPNGKAFVADTLWVVLDGENVVLRLEGPQG